MLLLLTTLEVSDALLALEWRPSIAPPRAGCLTDLGTRRLRPFTYKIQVKLALHRVALLPELFRPSRQSGFKLTHVLCHQRYVLALKPCLSPVRRNHEDMLGPSVLAPAFTVLFQAKSPPVTASSDHVPGSNIPTGVQWSDMSDSGSVVVVAQPPDQHCAAVGGVHAQRLAKLGVHGLIVRGRVRDLEEMQNEVSMPVGRAAFSCCFNAHDPCKRPSCPSSILVLLTCKVGSKVCWPMLRKYSAPPLMYDADLEPWNVDSGCWRRMQASRRSGPHHV